MRLFLQGLFSGALLSLLGLWMLKFSPWAPLPELKGLVFWVGATLMAGVVNLLLGNFRNASDQ